MTPPTSEEILARLAQHRSLGHAPPHEHEWLVAHGSFRTYEVGEVVTARGEQADAFLVMFSGHIVIRVDRGLGSHKIFEWLPGDVGGTMPYSRGSVPPSDVVAEERTEVLSIERSRLAEMTRECPTVTTTVVHAMLDRARDFKSSDLRDEKLLSLGKLAAGLAHELNNPASAVLRGARVLTTSLEALESSAQRLGAAHLTDAQLSAIGQVRRLCTEEGPTAPLSAMARADREDAISAWLTEHGADEACAVPLATTAVTLSSLDTLATHVEGEALDATLKWISAGCVVRSLSSEIEHAATRIHDLVASVKGFSFVGRATASEPVDLRRGLLDTLNMLATKRQAKDADISVEVADDLPAVLAVGAELNQVWMNLIDNALDAIHPGGHVTLTATQESGRVVVRVTDDGPGIPPDIRGRIFDPFFTTKDVGEGTGLGLDVVRRLVQSHDGEIEVESHPGRTTFQVRLPLGG